MAHDMIAVFHGGRGRRGRGVRLGGPQDLHDRTARQMIAEYDDERVLSERALSRCEIAAAIRHYGNARSACEVAYGEALWAGRTGELPEIARACSDFRGNAQTIADAARRCAESGAAAVQSGGMMNNARKRGRR